MGRGTSIVNTLCSCTQQWKSRWGLVAGVMATSLSALCFSTMEVWGHWFISHFLHPAVLRIILEEKLHYRLLDSNLQLFWTRKIHRCRKAPMDSNFTVNSNQCLLNAKYAVRAVICFHVYGFLVEIILLLFSIDFVFPSCIILDNSSTITPEKNARDDYEVYLLGSMLFIKTKGMHQVLVFDELRYL